MRNAPFRIKKNKLILWDNIFMISFDTNQMMIFNVGIDAFSICIVLILFSVRRWEPCESEDKRILFRLQIMLLMTLIADMIMWLVNGRPGPVFRFIGYADNMAYYIYQILVLRDWLKYAYCRLYEKYMSWKTELFAIVIPLGLIGLCAVTTPLTGWYFYLDQGNLYHRGALSFPISLIIIGYLFYISVEALLRRKKETLFERKRECAVMGFFVIPPLVGGIIQVVMYGANLIWPCTLLSILLLCLNIENQAISQDALTGLNNRGHLDRYLHTGIEKGQAVSIIMLDINDFKMFNDCYGHEMGDKVLVQTAGIIRSTFGGTAAFLSRYGGDEFIVALNGHRGDQPEQIMGALQKKIDLFNDTSMLPYELSLSMGYAAGTITCAEDITCLLKEADENMYREKDKFHNAVKARTVF